MHPILQGYHSPGIPKRKGREGGIETPGAKTWMQMPSRWARYGAATETRQEPRRMEKAGWRHMSQTGPQAKMRLDIKMHISSYACDTINTYLVHRRLRTFFANYF